MGFRSDLATHLRTQIPDVSVYEAGDDLVAVPAVVINPGDPYLIPTTMGAKASNMTNIVIVLVAPRGDTQAALNMLEDLRVQVTDAIKTNQPAGRWATFGQFGSTLIGDITHATASVECVFTDQDRGSS